MGLQMDSKVAGVWRLIRLLQRVVHRTEDASDCPSQKAQNDDKENGNQEDNQSVFHQTLALFTGNEHLNSPPFSLAFERRAVRAIFSCQPQLRLN
jgi:hypothetical protein